MFYVLAHYPITSSPPLKEKDNILSQRRYPKLYETASCHIFVKSRHTRPPSPFTVQGHALVMDEKQT